MRGMKLFAAAGVAVGLASISSAAPFGQGNLVVIQLNADGSATAPSNAAAPVFLKEFTTAGSAVQTIAVQSLASTSGNRALTMAGNATSEGALTMSTDGRYLVFGGYNADASTASIAATASATVNRVVGRVDCQGVVDTTTAFSAFSGGPVRSVASVDGTAFWMAGNGGTGQGTTAGIQYVAFAAPSAPIGLIAAPTNSRFVNIFAGQLYLGSASTSGGVFGLSAVGTGLPTTSGQIPTLLAGFGGTANPGNVYSQYDFYFADANTVYVADDGGAAVRGIQKWTQSGGLWTQQYVLQAGLTNAQIRQLTGVTVAGVTTLYATTGEPSANSLVTITDNGASSTFTVLATAPANTVFRGVEFTPNNCVVVPVTCYANCDGSTLPPVLNAGDFSCFLSKFRAAGSLSASAQITDYANCDQSTLPPVLNAGDFQCFLTKFRNPEAGTNCQ